MKTTLTTLLALSLAASPFVAAAQVGTNAPRATTTDVRQGERVALAKARALEEIDRRIGHLEALGERISRMARLPDASETELISIVNGQITALTALRADISAATDVEVLRTLVRSITESYRIYSLILPQTQIIASADRALAVAAQLTALSDKLEERIDTASTTDTTSLDASLADMRSTIADAEDNANDAIEAVESLRPDNGDVSARNANRDALKAAHAKVRQAQQNLVAARKAAGSIVRELRALNKPRVSTTTPSTATTTDED